VHFRAKPLDVPPELLYPVVQLRECCTPGDVSDKPRKAQIHSCAYEPRMAEGRQWSTGAAAETEAEN